MQKKGRSKDVIFYYYTSETHTKLQVDKHKCACIIFTIILRLLVLRAISMFKSTRNETLALGMTPNIKRHHEQDITFSDFNVLTKKNFKIRLQCRKNMKNLVFKTKWRINGHNPFFPLFLVIPRI